MANDPVLGTLGLAKRAGKLALGDDMARELCEMGKARCVLVACDAGGSTAKKAALSAERANIPCITLPQDRAALGGALGREGCAVCALGDIGLAASVAKRLAEIDPQYAEAAEKLSAKNTRIQSRKGKKKQSAASDAGRTGGADKPQTK